MTTTVTVTATVEVDVIKIFEWYWVDATLGDDDGLGTQVDPWQTVAKVNGATLDFGDNVLFKRGETWAGTTLTPPADGITFVAYGSGAKPCIDGNGLSRALYANVAYLRFDNIWFYRATGAGSTTVRIMKNDMYFYQCDFTDNPDGAGVAANTVTGAETYNLTFDQCLARDNYSQGFLVGSSGAAEAGLPGPHNVLIVDCVSHDNGVVVGADHGIYAQHGVIVRGCTSYNNASAGIKLLANGTFGSPYTPVAEKNVCYGNNYGILVYNPGSVVKNNICYSNNTNMRLLDNNSTGCYIYHNTLVNGAVSGITISTAATATGNVFKNNIILQDNAVVPTKLPLVSDSIPDIAANNTWNNNLYYVDGVAGTDIASGTNLAEWKALTGSPDANGMHADPVFVTNYTNLHLQSSSPCRNAGEDGLVTDDYDGVTRAAYDIGALEYVA